VVALFALDAVVRIDIVRMVNLDRAVPEVVPAAGGRSFCRRVNKERNAVEETKQRTHGADHAAEWTADCKHESDHAEKDAQLEPVPPPNHAEDTCSFAEQIGSGIFHLVIGAGNNGDARLETPGRAEGAKERFIEQRREDERENRERCILAISGPVGEPVFFIRQFSQKVLEKSERTEVAAVEPSGDYPERTDDTEREKRYHADDQKVLQCSDGAGALRKWTSVAIEHRYSEPCIEMRPDERGIENEHTGNLPPVPLYTGAHRLLYPDTGIAEN
jgi:hypothetical protein